MSIIIGQWKKNSAAILSRALELKDGNLPPAGARFILTLGGKESDKKRFLKLLAKNQKGRITAEELDDLESYVQVDNILSIWKGHAVLALKQAGQEP